MLTITGFFGPKVAPSTFSTIGLSLGLILVLAALVLLPVGSLRIHWLTCRVSAAAADTLSKAVAWRDRKARFFNVQLCLLLCGLSAYVAAVVNYFLSGVI